MLHSHEDLVSRGLARMYRGRLIPIMKGGDETEDAPEALFADVPADLTELSDEQLQALIDDYQETRAEILASPSSFVSADFPVEALLAATREAVEVTIPALLQHQADRAAPVVEETPAELSPEAQAAFDALAAPDEPEVAPVVEEVEPIVAAAVPPPAPSVLPAVRRMPRPARDREVVEPPASEARTISLTAAAGAPDMTPGQPFADRVELADAMVRRHRQFGQTGPGTIEKYSIAKADWRSEFAPGRKLNKADVEGNFELVSRVVNDADIRRAFLSRVHEVDKDLSLQASGGLCAPVSNYYGLQYLSVPDRPVMASLPSFNADRGGLRYARPATLASITTGVGIITEAEDAAGGTSATKSCQIIDCPPFQETDVDAVYHCLQFGNLGARAFPELVAQWNDLILAAHARLAESALLTSIDAFSTQVTASNVGFGATGALLGQILAAANGMRNRHRMNPEAVLRFMAPDWVIDLLISDVIRGQFQRFDTDEARITALLRSFDIEPTFYLDGASGKGQVFGTQNAGALLPFPATVRWYLFPEGSFLYLDGGQLELGIVRDSVLNATNDFQIFGENWENVAYVGIESLAVSSTICDSGTVSAPHATTCPISYA